MDSTLAPAADRTTELQLRVQAVEPITDDVSLFRLISADTSPLPAWEAGAHLGVHLEGGLTRAYSLCSDPAQRDYYDIAVKRQAQGRGGSAALHRQATPGARLRTTAPRNLFALQADAPFHLLLGGGIGVTPLLSMASVLHRQRRPFRLALFCRDAQHPPLPHAWRERFDGDTLRIFDTDRSGHIARLIAALPAGGHVYYCGTEGFMAQVAQSCAALPAAQLHCESFSVPTAPGSAGAQPVELVLARQQRSLLLAPQANMADALRQAGVTLETICEQGICGACVVRYLDGEPEHRDSCLSATEQHEYLAPCCAGSRSPRLVLDL